MHQPSVKLGNARVDGSPELSCNVLDISIIFNPLLHQLFHDNYLSVSKNLWRGLMWTTSQSKCRFGREHIKGCYDGSITDAKINAG